MIQYVSNGKGGISLMLINLMINKLKFSKVNKWFVLILILSLFISYVSPLAANAEQADAKEAKVSNTPYLTIQTKRVDNVNQTHIKVSEIDLIAQKHPIAVIEFKSEWGSYLFPVNAVDYAAWAKKLEVDLSDLFLQVTIEKVDDPKQLAVWKEKLVDAQLVSPLIRFTIELEANGKKIELTDYKRRYIQRTIPLLNQSDLSGLTAIIFDEETGNIAYIPALFQTLADKTEATISAPYEGLYGIIRSQKSFLDINQHWAKRDIELLASKLLIQGVTSTRFEPDVNITRSQFISLLVRSLGLIDDAVAAAGGFRDISIDDWYAGAVGAAFKAQIVGDNGEDVFEGLKIITREQMAVMIANALKFTYHSVNLRERADLVLSGFTDSELITGWAIPAMKQVIDTGIMTGKTKTSLAPKGAVTRAESVVILKRFLQFVHFIN
jgi:Holliday junction resolvase-like predicted endonuclease